MEIHGIGRSDIGLVRATNEDTFIADADLGLYAVCDGMGGCAGGEVAASTAVSSIQRTIRERRAVLARVEREPERAHDLVTLAEEALQRACRDIYTMAVNDDGLGGMGCTTTLLLAQGAKAAMAHVGDTRLYLIRDDGAHLLSSDHTIAAELARRGDISPTDVARHPHAHVLTRALGTQPLADVETLEFDLTPGDRLLLCSDGLSDYVRSPSWLSEVVQGSELEEVPDELIDYANRAGGHDNITVVAVGVDAPDHGGFEDLPSGIDMDVLGSSFLFAELTLAQLSRILRRCETFAFASGDVIARPGDIGDHLMVVMDGTVEVRAADGRSLRLGTGQHLGEHLVLRPRPIRSTITALSDVTILALDGPALTELSRQRPWLGVALLSKLVDCLSGDLDRGATSALTQDGAAAAELL
jgi:serine/threonine protein phosphatase PrpC